MTKAFSGRRLRIPMRLVDGKWEFMFGGQAPVKEGAVAELVVDRGLISDETFLEKMEQRDKHLERRKFLSKIAARAERFLKASPHPAQEMSWAENVLFQANLLGFDPSRKSPALWTEQAIAQNLDLMDQSVPYLQEKDSHPEKAETFEELINSLVPSEGGL